MATVFLDIAGNGQRIPVTIGRARMQRLAKHWHYVLRGRRRWIADDSLRETIEQRAADHLAAIGVDRSVLQTLAASDVVQVSIPLTPDSPNPDAGWEARLMPWEYLLTAATGKYRNGPLFVVRHLNTGRTPQPVPSGTLHATLIDSTPGNLRGFYDFNIERKVLRVHLAESAEWVELRNPTLAIIRDFMEGRSPEQSPALIHVSGIDSFLGKRLLAQSDEAALGENELRGITDGMFLRNEDWDETLVESRPLAQALTAAPHKPTLVSFNLYNSSARSAAFAVAEGAGAALGFQDFLDNRVAEIFFANFYLNWRLSGWHTLDAFKKTLSGLKPYADRLRGAGIVLWSSTSLVEATSPAINEPTQKKAKRQKAAAAAASISNVCTASHIHAEIKPIQALNYSILHNRQPIFKTFSIYKFCPGELSDLHVEVELQIGNERFGYRSTFTMSDHVRDLSGEIKIGLTSEMARSLQESVQTTLFVRVNHGDKPFLSDTHAVTLLPTDEWRDDGVNGIWLPSFVLPRDQTVLEVIVAAQRYLMALRDDAFAGFDGYQAIDESTADTDDLDAQVRAIWYALLHDYRLNYINPPPVFTAASQRLRTPTDVLRGGRGTCIDLALLVAACLELIDIKPVIFLLNGHAFPGYWSSETIREEFLVGPNPLPLMAAPDNPTPLPSDEEDVESGATETLVQQFPWEFDSSRYSEVFKAIQDGDIVPLESTMLTTGGGFWEAIDQAIDNLRNPEDFHSMLDIGLARDNHVTPLPLASLSDRARDRP
jgi:hypothetical protein